MVWILGVALHCRFDINGNYFPAGKVFVSADADLLNVSGEEGTIV